MANTKVRGVRFRRLKRVLKAVLPTCAALMLVVLAIGYSKYSDLVEDLPSLEKFKDQQNLTTRVLDRNGALIGELGSEKRIPIPYAKMPKLAIDALIASEDADFFENSGISWSGIARAFVANLKKGSNTQGGSTITQQLVKLFIVGREKSYERKFREFILARRVRSEFSPEWVLETYLNKVNFGYARNGIEAAANFYFGKSAMELTLAESAMLIGILPSPTYWSPLKNMKKALEKEKRVLARMLKCKKIDQAQYDAALKNPPQIVPYRSEEAKTGQEILDMVRLFLEKTYAKAEIDHLGFTIWTSVDLKVQASAKQALQLNNRLVAERNGTKYTPEGAVVVLDSERKIVAIVGGANYAPGGQNRAIEAWRQPGSTYKGFVYAAGFEAEKFGPYTEFSNAMTVYNNDSGPPWSPDNYRGEASDVPVFTVKNAFAESLNRVAARAICGLWPGSPLLSQSEYSLKSCREYGLVGATIDLSERAGINWSKLDPPGKNPSIALGTTGVTPMDMLVAYMAIGLDGEYVEPTLITKIEGKNAPAIPQTKRHSVVGGKTVSSMKVLMRAVVEEGTGRRASGKLPEPAYGKTGTTNRSTNAWFVGGTSSYWSIVWVGHKDQGTSLGYNETGAKTSLPVWLVAMNAAYGRESEAVRAMRGQKVMAPSVEAPEVEESVDSPVPTEESPASGTQETLPVENNAEDIGGGEGSGTDLTAAPGALAPNAAPSGGSAVPADDWTNQAEGSGTDLTQ